MRNRSLRLVVSIAILAAVLISLPGCYGSFNLTRQMHSFNGGISESEWIQEITFLGMVIIPVYGVGMLGDAIIFNSIEFWGGDNPVAEPADFTPQAGM